MCDPPLEATCQLVNLGSHMLEIVESQNGLIRNFRAALICKVKLEQELPSLPTIARENLLTPLPKPPSFLVPLITTEESFPLPIKTQLLHLYWVVISPDSQKMDIIITCVLKLLFSFNFQPVSDGSH